MSATAPRGTEWARPLAPCPIPGVDAVPGPAPFPLSGIIARSQLIFRAPEILETGPEAWLHLGP
eukprot:3200182-Pyramimonas_sp.AAC.1